MAAWRFLGLFALLGSLSGCWSPRPEPPASQRQGLGGACVDLFVGPEVGILAPAPAANVGGSLRLEDACSDGLGYLLVFSRQFVELDGGSRYEIHAIRVRPDGWPLDPVGTRLPLSPGSVGNAACAFDGTQYVVAWVDGPLGAARPRLARLSPSGQLLDPAGLAVPFNGTQVVSVGLSAFAGVTLVAWDEPGVNSLALHGVRVASDGSAVDSSPLVLAGAVESDRPVLGHDNSTFLAAWTPPNGLYVPGPLQGCFVPLDGGAPSAAVPLTSDSSAQYFGHLSFDGSNYLVAWLSGGLRVTRLAPTGQVLTPTTTVVSSSGNPGGPWTAFDGKRHVIGWGGGYLQGYLAQVDTQGLLATAPFLLTGSVYASSPVLTSDRHHTLAIWGTGAVLLDTFVDQQGTLERSGIVVAGVPNPETGHAAAWGATPIAVWADRRGGDYDLYAARMSPDAGRLDPLGLLVARAAGDQLRPSIAAGDAGYLVVWEDWRSGVPAIWGERLDPDGLALDDGGFAISASAASSQAPSVTHDGTRYVVAWEDTRSGSVEVFGARVAEDAAVLDPGGVQLSATAGDHYAPSLCALGGTTWLAWQEYLDGGERIASATWSTAGVQPLPPVGGWARVASDPALACRNAQVLLAWSGPDRVLGALASDADAGFGPPVALSVDGGAPGKPRAVFDGTAWVLTWSDANSANTAPNLYVERVRTDGGATGPQLLRGATPDPALSVGLASNGSSSTMVVWSGSSGPLAPDGWGRAVFLQTPPLALGSACGCGEVCGSAACVDGVCCDEPCEGDAGSTRCVSCKAPGADAGVCTALAQGTTCRWRQGACDVAETCDGVSRQCPADALQDAGATCRLAQSLECDVPEYCDGQSPFCPPDVQLDAGLPCDAGLFCFTDGVCLNGACRGTYQNCPLGPCGGGSQCVPGVGCASSWFPDGTACVDPDNCRKGVCLEGQCDAGPDTGCPDFPCLAGACDSLGHCFYVANDDGTTCGPGDACSLPQRCLQGACVSGPPRCVGDTCRGARCNLDGGGCIYSPAPDGTRCDGGTCQSGACEVADSGVADAGSDAGAPGDAGHDGGTVTSPDGGSPPGAQPGGCGCSGSVWGSLWAALLSVALRVRRRSGGRRLGDRSAH